MQIRYREGTSLEQIDAIPGYSVGTLRAYVLAAGTVLSDATDGESKWVRPIRKPRSLPSSLSARMKRRRQ